MVARKLVVRGILALIVTGCSLKGDSVCVTNGACDDNWQPFVTPIQHTQQPGPVGPVYFDGFSYDAPDANIAYFIEGQGAFLNDPASPDATLPFWGNADGSAVPSFYFQSDGQTQLATMILADAQWAPYNSLGWYDPNSSAWGWIFQANGAQPTVPQSVEFTPTAEFGLFFVPDFPNPANFTFSDPYYATNSSLNGIAAADVAYANANNITLGPETPYQHFAVFESANSYYVGVNDRSNQVGDLDYNDMVFTLASVPEPRYSFILAALSITSPFWLRRLRASMRR